MDVKLTIPERFRELGLAGSVADFSASKNDVDVRKHLRKRKSTVSEPEENECSNLPPAAHPHVLVRHFLLSCHILTLDSTIFGRAIKSEYLTIGVLSTPLVGTAWLSTRGG